MKDPKEISPGLYMADICEICGKKKSLFNHVRCSKLKQKKYETQRDHINQSLYFTQDGKS